MRYAKMINLPLYVAVDETKVVEGNFPCQHVNNGNFYHSISQSSVRKSWFGTEMYEPITEKEFLAAKAAVKHILDSFGTEIIK